MLQLSFSPFDSEDVIRPAPSPEQQQQDGQPQGDIHERLTTAEEHAEKDDYE